MALTEVTLTEATSQDVSPRFDNSLKRKVVLGVAALFAAASAPLVVPSAANAHGWVVTPPSRQAHCAQGNVSWDCQGVQWEPQSVEAPKGSMECNGGGTAFSVLNDDTLPWPRTEVGNSVTIQWNLTAAHNTSTWEYFVDGQLHQVFNENGRPPSNVSHVLTNLPAGDHTILARWNVADTPMAFYNCIDLRVNGNGGGGPEPTPTPSPTPTPTPTPEVPHGEAWSAGVVYVKDDLVSHGGYVWQAQWWTTDEEPGTTGPWGVWRSVGKIPGSGHDGGTDQGDGGHGDDHGGDDGGDNNTGGETTWDAGTAYNGGDTVIYNGQTYRAAWWTQGDIPGAGDQWSVWRLIS